MKTHRSKIEDRKQREVQSSVARRGLCVIRHWSFVFGISLALPFSALAQSSNDIPALRPPHAEIPPTFWEQHTVNVSLVGFALLALIGVALWLATRPKPPVVVPPEVQARVDLASLRQLPEEGRVLSKVSQTVRRYFGAAFALPPGELTTAEFCQAMAGNGQIGTNLANDLFDHEKGADTHERLGPPRASALGLIPPAHMRTGMALVFGAAAAVGLYLFAVAGWPVLAAGALAIAACDDGAPRSPCSRPSAVYAMPAVPGIAIGETPLSVSA
jgi:hypothetical protein